MLLCQIRDIIVLVGGNALAPNRRNSLPCIVWTPDKGCAIKRLVVCWNMARNNDLWDGSMDKHKVRGLVPCGGQDGYRAQVPQHTYNGLFQIVDIFNIKQQIKLLNGYES